MTATKRKPKPITANPLFPLVTALWVATLLGLGSFATAPALLEGPVLALGIPAWIPAAAPPLGFTTRMIFAVAMLGVGAVFGYGLGRFLGREKAATAERMRGPGKKTGAAAEAVRQPINAAEDLGVPLDAPFETEAPARRRALAQAAEAPVDFAAAAPAFIAAPIDHAHVHAERQEFQPAPDGADLLNDADDVDPLGLDLLYEEACDIEPEPVAASQPVFAALRQEFAPASEPAPFNRPEPEAVPESETLAMAPPQPAQIAPAPVAPVPAAPVPFLQARTVDATPIGIAPLESLGLVQLVERLALAISRSAARTVQPEQKQPEEPVHVAPVSFVAPEPATAPAIARFEMPAAATAAEPFGESAATAATVSLQEPEPEPEPEHEPEPERIVQLRPAMLPPFQTSDEMAQDTDDLADDGEQDAGLERFLRMSPLLARKSDQIAEAFGVTNDAAPEPEVAEDCYSSLLDMGPVAPRREPLRIDDSMYDDDAEIEHDVVFPGQGAPWTADVAKAAAMPVAPVPAAPVQTNAAPSRPFERPSVVPVPGSPLASPGRAAPSVQSPAQPFSQPFAQPAARMPVPDADHTPSLPDAEEADRALRAALETLQRMTARG